MNFLMKSLLKTSRSAYSARPDSRIRPMGWQDVHFTATNLLVKLQYTVWLINIMKRNKSANYKTYSLKKNSFFADIYAKSGVNDQYKNFGSFYSYQSCPRALIFKRDHVKVVDTDSMITLMRSHKFEIYLKNKISFSKPFSNFFLNKRSNNFTKDPLSRCNCSPPYSGLIQFV